MSRAVALAGEAPRNLVVSEWQSLAAAQAWLNSADLAALAPQREKAYRVIRQYIVQARAD
jgi:heme-degrading monooxygenase HmoA